MQESDRLQIKPSLLIIQLLVCDSSTNMLSCIQIASSGRRTRVFDVIWVSHSCQRNQAGNKSLLATIASSDSRFQDHRSILHRQWHCISASGEYPRGCSTSNKLYGTHRISEDLRCNFSSVTHDFVQSLFLDITLGCVIDSPAMPQEGIILSSEINILTLNLLD